MEIKYLLLTISIFVSFYLILNSAEAAVVTVCSSGCDSTTVQGAINSASNYDEVRITDSRFYNEGVNITKPIKLTSSSNRPTIWKSNNDGIINISANDTFISNIAVVLNNTNFNYYSIQSGEIIRLKNTTIINVTITSTGAGIQTVSDIANITNNTILSNFTGIDLSAVVNGSYVIGNIITINSTVIDCPSGLCSSNFGIEAEGVDNVISNNTIYSIKQSKSTGTYGIRRGSWSETATNANTTISYNTIYSNDTAIFIDTVSGLKPIRDTIFGNIIVTNGTGIEFASGGVSTATSGFNISSNVITASNTFGDVSAGILLTRVGTSRFYDNNITTNGSSGSHGIQGGTATATSNIFKNNRITVFGSGSYGILIGDDNTTVVDSVINSTDDSDVRIAGTASKKAYLINDSFNKTDISVGSITNSMELFIQWPIDIRVVDSTNSPVNGANVFINDTTSISDIENPSSNLTVPTNSSGYTLTQNITEFMANGTYNSSSGYLYFNNYTINASRFGVTDSVTLNITTGTSVTLTLAIDSSIGTTINPNPASWNDTVNVTGVGDNGVSVTARLDGATICTAIVGSSGIWSCNFLAPLTIGSYNLSLTVGSTVTDHILAVRPTYGEEPTGTTSRSVLELPMLIQEPSGIIRTIISRLKVSRGSAS